MTYKLEPGLARITSPIEIIFPDGTRREYVSGVAVTEAVFDKKYQVIEIKAVAGTIQLTLAETNTEPSEPSTWIGEEQTSFF